MCTCDSYVHVTACMKKPIITVSMCIYVCRDSQVLCGCSEEAVGWHCGQRGRERSAHPTQFTQHNQCPSCVGCTELEEGTPIINWSSELVDEMGGYLYPLWNRTAGDCLLDSVLQATWGVMDRDGTLRRALADSLVDGESL